MSAMVTLVGEGSIGEISEVRIRGVLTIGDIIASAIQVRVRVSIIGVVVSVPKLVVEHINDLGHISELGNLWTITKAVSLQILEVLVATEVNV